MESPIPSRRRFLALGFAATAGLAGCVVPGDQETERTTRTVDAPANAPLVVDNHNGDVTVTGGGTDAIDLEITKRTNYGRDLFSEVTVETDASGDRIRVETVTGDVPMGASVSVDLQLTLPGSVTVERARTRNGDVTVEDVPGDATLETTNGRVDADGVDGFLTLRSTNGTVEAHDVAGIDGASTSNGDVDVEIPAIRGDTTLETTNGDVRASAAADLDAEVELRTTNGDVSYGGLDLQVETDRETHLRGTLGAGGDQLLAKTTNGDVRLRAI